MNKQNELTPMEQLFEEELVRDTKIERQLAFKEGIVVVGLLILLVIRELYLHDLLK